MREITKEMIDEFRINELGHDFMGYSLQKTDMYNFHHLIIRTRMCNDREDLGYYKENGAILCGNTSHPYLHVIESRDSEIFGLITSEMLDMNLKGYLDRSNLRYIDDCLTYFEKEHCSDRTNKGKMLIKPEFLIRNKF